MIYKCLGVVLQSLMLSLTWCYLLEQSRLKQLQGEIKAREKSLANLSLSPWKVTCRRSHRPDTSGWTPEQQSWHQGSLVPEEHVQRNGDGQKETQQLREKPVSTQSQSLGSRHDRHFQTSDLNFLWTGILPIFKNTPTAAHSADARIAGSNNVYCLNQCGNVWYGMSFDLLDESFSNKCGISELLLVQGKMVVKRMLWWRNYKDICVCFSHLLCLKSSLEKTQKGCEAEAVHVVDFGQVRDDKVHLAGTLSKRKVCIPLLEQQKQIDRM